ncbi:MAG: hypothetical protein LBC63_08740 [Holophagales bacterium]|jgi:flagellar hook-associated protein 3 FlgL|nr:hypothetical protein [Holophagales bacterium]
MSLRTPNPFRSYQTLIDFQRSKERLSVVADQIASGRRITRLSDDPTGAALVMDFQNSIERNTMYIKQGETASTFLKGTESALNAINIQMDRLLELSEAAMSDLQEGKGRDAMSAEVDILRTIILDLSNTKEQGKYIFAGTATQTIPFSVNPNPPVAWPVPNPAALVTGSHDPYQAVFYDGNLGVIDLDISPVASVTANLTGEYVFLGNRIEDPPGSGTYVLDPNQDIFIAITQLRDGMINDDTDLIKQAYDNLKLIKDRVNVCLTIVGSRTVSIENTGFNLGDFTESLQSIQNAYDGLEYPRAITQLTAEQTSQQASLSILSKLGRLSLFDYIG